MTCDSKVNLGDGGVVFGFYAVCAGSEENDKATPAVQFYVQTVNEAAAAKFEIGKYYYVDFSPAVWVKKAVKKVKGK